MPKVKRSRKHRRRGGLKFADMGQAYIPDGFGSKLERRMRELQNSGATLPVALGGRKHRRRGRGFLDVFGTIGKWGNSGLSAIGLGRKRRRKHGGAAGLGLGANVGNIGVLSKLPR